MSRVLDDRVCLSWTWMQAARVLGGIILGFRHMLRWEPYSSILQFHGTGREESFSLHKEIRRRSLNKTTSTRVFQILPNCLSCLHQAEYGTHAIYYFCLNIIKLHIFERLWDFVAYTASRGSICCLVKPSVWLVANRLCANEECIDNVREKIVKLSLGYDKFCAEISQEDERQTSTTQSQKKYKKRER